MAGPNIYDQIINGSFDAIGAKPAYLSPQTSVAEMYKGIYPPAAPKPTYQAGMTGRGLPASMGMDRLPQGTAGLPGPTGSGLTPQQLAALGGWSVDPRTGQLAYAQPGPTNPAIAAATQQAQNVPLPRPRPPNAPTWLDMAAINAPPQMPVGANPGMGGAMIGNGQMASGIPPQLPPADGSSPLPVWAGDNPQQAGGQPLGINVHGGQQPTVSPGQRYSLANMLGQINAQKAQSNATGQAGGYQYKDGQKVGYATQTIGNKAYIPFNPSAAYGLANAAGQINALNKQATATGNTGVYSYQNGVKTGTVGGGTGAQAYDRAAAAARQSSPDNGGNPSWW